MAKLKTLMTCSLVCASVAAAAPASSEAFAGRYVGRFCSGSGAWSSCYEKYVCPRSIYGYVVRSRGLPKGNWTDCQYRKRGRWYY